MTRVARPTDLVQDQSSITKRGENLATGAHRTVVKNGGYGRNRMWATAALYPGAHVTDGGKLQWCIVGDRVVLETHGGELNIGGLYEEQHSGLLQKVIAKIHPHGAPGTNWPYYPSTSYPLPSGGGGPDFYPGSRYDDFNSGQSRGYNQKYTRLVMTPLGELVVDRFGSVGSYDTNIQQLQFFVRMVYPLG